ncbi:MAG: SPOR domain-containing protein [Gemmatimonadota bacterium]
MAGAVLVPALLFGTASSIEAQESPGATALDSIEAAADRGEVTAAREALAAFLESGAEGRSSRLDFLAGRLSADPDSARVAFLRAAIDGEGEYAARARLRLAQLELARGDHERSAEHLGRLRSDDPGGPLAPISWVWSARVAEMSGDVSTACAAWSEALTALPDDHPAVEEARQGRSRCEESARQPGEVQTFTVQLGAFGSEDAALRLRDGAAEAGVAVRVEGPSGAVRVYRVRSGRYGSREDAERLADRFRDRGFEAIVVPEEP